MPRLRQTLGDCLAIAISPVLIMALVGSLVFFLVEVLYAGKYEGRLEWMLFCFVAGAVLIARMSMTGGIAERAKLYGLVLGISVYIALLRFVTFPEGTVLAPFSWAINLSVMILIWWCAHRLTWDCTHIDDASEASGAGLLEVAGLDKDAPPADEAPAAKQKKKPSAPQFGLVGWWDRYQAYREAQEARPHNPGVWIVYFSLAAFPLFGLGQALIPAADSARRRYVFWLMAIYVASGLGLLLATCYLGLRRYLRQRKLRMPAAMTGLWLLLGGGLVVALLVTAAVLPRPSAEYALIRLKRVAGSKERGASKHAAKGDSPTKGEGRRSNDRSSDSSQAKDGKGGNRDSQASNQRGGKGNGNSRAGQNTAGKGGSKGKSKDSGKGSQDDKSDRGDKDAGSKSDDNSSPQQDSSDASHSSDSLLSHLGTAGQVLKWVVFGIMALAVLFVAFRSGLKWLANFTDWARRLLESLRKLWESLFGIREKSQAAETNALMARACPPRPFSAFPNPFRMGAADQWPPEELVQYSFEALEALAREHDLGRSPDETPLEFITQLTAGIPVLEREAQGLAALYVQVAYAHGPLPAASVERLRVFWDRLEAAAEHSLSA